jgi:AcrR family transcriptional regulator
VISPFRIVLVKTLSDGYKAVLIRKPISGEFLARQKPSRGAQDRERDLIAVASKHLNTMGVSLEWFGEIAAELGISRPALYKYVVDRDDLLFKCYLRSCDLREAALQAARAQAANPRHVLESFLAETNRPGAPEIAVLTEIDALSPDRTAIIRARRDSLLADLADTLQRGVREGFFRPLDAAVVANTVLGLADWPSLYRRWAGDTVVSLDPAVLTELLFGGLAADRQVILDDSIDLTPSAADKVDLFDRRAVDAAKREAILLNASILFNRRGIGATRVEDVGAAVGLSKRAIFHHVANKAALVDACVERAIAYYLGVMDASDRLQASRLDVFAQGVRASVETAGHPERAVLVPYVGFGLLSPRSQKAMYDFSVRLTDGYRKLLDEGEREGSIRKLPREPVLASMPGLFSWVSASPFGSETDRSKIARELATITAKGILA